VVDGSVGSGGSRGKLSKLNDFSTTLLDTGSKLVLNPSWVNEAEGVLSLDSGVSDIGVHGWRVVAPDGEVFDVGNLGTGLKSELGDGSVVIEAGHGRERVDWQILGIVLADQSVGVSGVADNDGFDITGAVIVDGLSNVDENLAVILEQVSTLHAWAAGLCTDQEVVIDIRKSSFKVAGADDFVKQGESAVMELSLDTLEYLLLEWQVEQVEDDSLILAKELSTIYGQAIKKLTMQF